MTFEEKTLDSERIYDGAILNVRRDTVQAKKKVAHREIIEHNGAVAIVAITSEDKIVMVNQFRYACRRDVLEIPAGKIEKGETDPQLVATRELKEETGYEANEVTYMGKIYPSCGYSEEVIHIYLMRDLTGGDQNLDDDEAIDIIEMPYNELYDMCMNGEIEDAKTLAALLMAMKYLY